MKGHDPRTEELLGALPAMSERDWALLALACIDRSGVRAIRYAVGAANELALLAAQPADTDVLRPCQCGEWSGDSCGTSATDDQMVRMEFMPAEKRELLERDMARGGGLGWWPHNGARRIWVAAGCADRMMAEDGTWCSRVVA